MKRWRWVVLASLVAMAALMGSCGGGQGNPPFNATPTLTGIFPSNITAGSAGFIMFITGTGFMSGSTGVTFAYWNGSARSTTLNDQTGELEVQVLASDLAVANPSVNITVANPAPGGGVSVVPEIFDVVQPLAGLTIGSSSPANTTSGHGAFTLTVNGTGFASNDVVLWNGNPRTTMIAPMNTTVATAQITAADVASVGSASVAVSMPNEVTATPSLSFAITGANNPSPALTSLSPSSASAGSGDLQVRIDGSGFTQFSTAEWIVGGVNSPLATAFISSSEIIVLVPAADLATMTSAMIGVSNPAPGGGSSQPKSFSVN